MKTLTPLEWHTIKVIVSLIALGILLLHILFPHLVIDTTALLLLALAFLPWIAPIIKHIELPWGVKVELKELEQLGEDAKDSGLIAKKRKLGKKTYTFETVASIDPNLALAGLRIEVERVLLKLAKQNELENLSSSVVLLRHLVREDILSVEEGVVLSDLLHVLNKAVHGAIVDEEASTWALSTGIGILDALEAKLA